MSTEKKIYLSTDYTGEAIAPHQQFVTDAEGKTLWEDRTHYTVTEEVTVLPDGDYELVDSSIIFPDVISPTIVEGGKYTVMIEGEEFDDIGATTSVDGLDVVYIGNLAVPGLGDDNGKPYIMFVLADAGMASSVGMYGEMVIIGLDSTTVHLSIVGTAETAVKIPEKYIPDAKNSFLVNGSAAGSIRTVFSAGENDEYKMGVGASAEGILTKASNEASHAEGSNTTASGYSTHAEGTETTASGDNSHAEGSNTTASGNSAHAEGYATVASSMDSHAEGWETAANAVCAHSEGMGTVADSHYQHVQGKFNVKDNARKYAHIVGNGDSEEARSNAHTLDWSGNAWFKGSVYVGGTGQTDTAAIKILPAKLVSTETTPTTNDTICWLYE